MADNLKNSVGDVSCYEEMTITKTEVKEELYDFEMTTPYTEFVNVKEEPEDNFEDGNLGFVKGMGQSLNETLDVGKCESRKVNRQSLRGHYEQCSVNKNISKDTNSRSKFNNAGKRFRSFKCTYKDCKCVPDQKEFCECGTCRYAATTKAILKRHVLIKHTVEKKQYRCNLCEYFTDNKTHLTRHAHIHAVERPFTCPYKHCKCTPEQKESCKCDMCEYAAELKSSLKAHILMMHSAEAKKFKCKHCNYATHAKAYLTVHTRTHTDEKPFKCTYKNCKCTPGQEKPCECDICGYAAIQRPTLKIHILVNHNTAPKRYQCKDCNYATHRRSSLVSHTRIHANEDEFKCTYKNCECTREQAEYCECDTCGYATANIKNLKEHIFVNHNPESKKFKCRDCSYATHKKSRLEMHSRVHTDERPFKCTYKNCKCTPEQKECCECDTCEYAATYEVNLKAHVLVKHSAEPKKYKCTDCDFTAHIKRALTAHVRTHTGDRPFKCTYKNCKCTPGEGESCGCDMCWYAAGDKSSLNKHILAKHSTEVKKYKCEDCEYVAHTKRALILHTRTHTNERS